MGNEDIHELYRRAELKRKRIEDELNIELESITLLETDLIERIKKIYQPKLEEAREEVDKYRRQF